MISYLIPALLAVLVVLAGLLTLWIVSMRKVGTEADAVPFAEDHRTPLGATDELSDAPPSTERPA